MDSIIDGIETRIWLHGGWKRIKLDGPVNIMKAAYSFCLFNSLPPSRLVRLSGGYYIVGADGIMTWFCRNLSGVTFRELYEELKRQTIIDKQSIP